MLKFELSLEEANLVLASLSKQSYEIVSVLIAKIHAQANEQLQKAKIDSAVDEIISKPE